MGRLQNRDIRGVRKNLSVQGLVSEVQQSQLGTEAVANVQEARDSHAAAIPVYEMLIQKGENEYSPH